MDLISGLTSKNYKIELYGIIHILYSTLLVISFNF